MFATYGYWNGINWPWWWMPVSTANSGSAGDEYEVEAFHGISDPPISLNVEILRGGLYDEDQPLTLGLGLKNHRDIEVRFSERREAQFNYALDSIDDPQFVLWPVERVEGKVGEFFTFTDCWVRIKHLGITLDLQSESIGPRETLESQLYLMSAGSESNEDSQLEPTCPDEVPKEVEFESSVHVRNGDLDERYSWGFRLLMPTRTGKTSM